MPIASVRSTIRANERYAWHGQSLLITNARGDCDSADAASSLAGYYFRETRYLSALRLRVNGRSPWICEDVVAGPRDLCFSYAYPEVANYGGGGSGQSRDETPADEDGLPQRAIDIRVRYRVGIASLDVEMVVGNRTPSAALSIEVGWLVDADFADIQEALAGARRQEAVVRKRIEGDGALRLSYDHPQLPYATTLRAFGARWTTHDSGFTAALTLDPGETASMALRIRPVDYVEPYDASDIDEREQAWCDWSETLMQARVPGNSAVEATVGSNVRDIASFVMFQGQRDEWLAPQAGMPLYPALFGRDALTASWQAACIDHGQFADAALTRIGRLQGTRIDDWRDEEPGRILHSVRQGPLARLNLNPYAAYYGDYASPMMFVITLAHAFAWSGDERFLTKHWDTARRIMDWARERGDRDGDGYLEYQTRSPEGATHQGWKDSGNAVLDEQGKPVAGPLGTCELQGYWFAAQEMMAALSWTRGERDDAKAYWHSARSLKHRFNRDWWMPAHDFFAIAMDADKRLVPALTSNVGQCIATGIIDDDHLPPVVGRMFAPDLFSGWGVRTLSTTDRSYNPIDYHLGSVWAVENGSIVFGLRRFGFDERALELSQGLFDLAAQYEGYRIPETVGGYARSEWPSPGAYPQANTPQLWNASLFPMLLQSILGLQPVAPLSLLVIDPVLPEWMPEVILERVRIGGAEATLRFWRTEHGESHGEIVHKRGTLHLLRQPPLESVTARTRDRFRALVDTLVH